MSEPFLMEEKSRMRCPNCNSDYVKFARCVMIPGNDSYDAHPNVRGDVIRLHGECEECDPGFTLFLGFHKGMTFMWAEAQQQEVNSE